MRLSFSKSKNATSLYVIKDFTEKNTRTTKIVEKLGTLKELEKKLNGQLTLKPLEKKILKEIYSINTELISKEEAFDGFYAVCTNLEDNASEIIKVNNRRWEIEECFRIMKSEFKARPIYLSRDDRIEAHFMTCFISLIIYRLLEKKLDEKYTCCEIVSSLKDMNFYEIRGDGYVPTYMRTDFTDDLHDAFGFRTDYQIVNTSQMKKILKQQKNKNITHFLIYNKSLKSL